MPVVPLCAPSEALPPPVSLMPRVERLLAAARARSSVTASSAMSASEVAPVAAPTCSTQFRCRRSGHLIVVVAVGRTHIVLPVGDLVAEVADLIADLLAARPEEDACADGGRCRRCGRDRTVACRVHPAAGCTGCGLPDCCSGRGRDCCCVLLLFLAIAMFSSNGSFGFNALDRALLRSSGEERRESGGCR